METRKFNEHSDDMRLNRQARYTNSTGRCPVCQVRPSWHGITCGDWGCLNHWLPGGDRSIRINKSPVAVR